MLRGNVRLITKNGLVTVSELAGQEVEIWNDGWYLAKIWKTGRDHIKRLVLSNGLYFDATEDQYLQFGGQDVQLRNAVGRVCGIVPIAHGWPGGDDLGIEERDWTALGFFQGDGGFKADTTAVVVHIGENDDDVRAYFDSDGSWHNEYKYYLSTEHRFVRLIDKIEMPRVILPERYVASKVFTATTKAVKWFIKGVFSANGTIILTGEVTGPLRTGRVNLRSTCRELMKGLQLLLHAMGYRTYIIVNPVTTRKFHNGMYECRESYDLNIAGAYGKVFTKDIGFIHQYKMDKANKLRAGKSFNLRPVKALRLDDIGEEDVYEFSEPMTKHAWVDGFISRID